MLNNFKTKNNGLLLALSSLCLISFSANTLAAGASSGQGVLKITGELVNSTCVIDTSKTPDPIVIALPKVGTNTLTKAGDVAGTKAIIISVKDCPVTGQSGGPGTPVYDKIAAFFEARSANDWDTSTGNLVNTFAPASGSSDVAATNVQVRLFNWAGGSAITLGTSGDYFKVLSDGTSELKYNTGYYATDKTTAGKVEATANYTLVYP